MADKSLELLISTPADTTGAKEATAAMGQLVDESQRYQATLERMARSDANTAQDKRLEGLRAEVEQRRQWRAEADAQIQAESATKTATDESRKASESNTAATDAAFTSKKQLKDMLKQLQHEFPLLGSVGRLALNPIAFTAAAIVASFQLFKYRVDELTRSLGGIQMPDVSDDQIARIERAGAALATYAVHLKGIGDAERSVKTAFDAQLARIDTMLETAKRLNAARAEMTQAMGGTPSATADQDAERIAEDLRIRTLQQEQVKLRDAGKAKLAAAGTVTSVEDEINNAAKYKQAADEAEKAIKDAKDRKKEIDDAQNMGDLNPVGFYARGKLLARYGDKSYAEMQDIESEVIRKQQETVGQYSSYQANAAEREARRKQREEAQGLFKQADDLTPEIQKRLEAQQQRRATDSAVGAINFATAAQQEGRTGAGTLFAGAEAADAAIAGAASTKESQAAIAAAAKALGITSMNSQQILRILSAINDNQTNFEKALKQLEARVNNSRAK